LQIQQKIYSPSYISTDFGVDSSSHFPFKSTEKQTNSQMQQKTLPMPWLPQAWVIKPKLCHLPQNTVAGMLIVLIQAI